MRTKPDTPDGADRGRLLGIAPQVHAGARPFFPPEIAVETLDIDPAAGCTDTGDFGRHNAGLADGSFDHVGCTEVLELVLRLFDAVEEIGWLLRPGGTDVRERPFQLPHPRADCWRFTAHGLRALLARFEIVAWNALETPDRPLMPVHYPVARKHAPAGDP